MTAHPLKPASPITFAEPETRRCPFPAYEVLRDEAPVYRDPSTGNYILSRYSHIREAALDLDAFSNETGMNTTLTREEAVNVFRKDGWLPLPSLTFQDPPEHTTYRALVDKVFTPQRIAALEPRMLEIIGELCEAIPKGGEFDFIQEFALPLPMFVIAEQLGVAREDMAEFKLWSDATVSALDPTLSPEELTRFAEIQVRMQKYMARQVELARDEAGAGLVSALVHLDLDGRPLDMRELLALLQQILVAGNETTTAAIGSGMKAMIEQPHIAEAICERPELAEKFTEEILRVRSPIQCMFRRTTRDVTIGDSLIPAGSIVELRYGSANRDPAQFKDAAHIDLERSNARSHVAFGVGPHFCLGNRLARSEMRLAFEVMARRFTGFEATRGEDSYTGVPSYIAHGLSKLWMRCQPR